MNKLVLATVAASIPTAVPALPPLAETASAPHPDSALFDLITQFVAADREYRALLDSIYRIEQGAEKAFKVHHEMPEVLRWKKSDAKLGLPHPYVCNVFPEPLFDRDMQVEPLRGKKWVKVVRVPVKGHPIKGMFYSKMTMFTPSKAARIRADEIIATYDNWKKSRDTKVAYPRGFKKLERQRDRADEMASELQFRVCETRAITIDGMLAKIRAAHATLWCKPDEILDTNLENLSGCAEEIADSIFRDLQAIAAANAPLVPTA